MKRLAKKLKRKLLKIAKQWVKYWALNRLLPRAYAKAAQAPVAPDKVVFVENKQADLSDSYKVIYERLTHDYTFDVRFVSLGQNRVRFKKYFRNCEAMLQEIATAKYVFLNDASDVVSCVDLRPETKVVQLWHACGAFKKWGMSTADLIFGGSRKQLLAHPFYKNLSLVTVSSPEVEWAYVEAMVLEGKKEIVKPLGVSRTDVFFDQDFIQSAHDTLEKLVPQSKGKRVILYAPTFRGRVAKAQGPDALDVAAFKAALGEEYVLLIKHHPFVKELPEIPEDCRDFAFQITEFMPIDQLLCVSDVVISDYSSLVFEYSLFEKPLIFFAYDIDEYNDWRGFYYNYDELTPGPVFSRNKEMISYIQNIDAEFDKKQVAAFRKKFMSACDGHATGRICQEVFGHDLQTYHRPTVAEKLAQRNPGGKDISIIIPAYNAMPYIKEAVGSVLSQTYDRLRMQLLVVDDGSVDGTWEYLLQQEKLYPDLISAFKMDVNSGSPAAPRNLGISKALGTYLFFLDADDWLGDRAVEKMIVHAEEWESDVLLVKMVGEGGRKVPQDMFKLNESQVDVFQSKVMWTFGPWKLFRRSFISSNHLAFPPFMPEDISFVLRAYVLARVVSVASDYRYYHCRLHDETKQESFNTWNSIDTNLDAFRDIFGFIDGHVTPENRNQTLMRRLFRRDICNMLISATTFEEPKRSLYIKKIADCARRYYVPEMYETCPIDKRFILEAGLMANPEALCQVVRVLTSEPDAFFDYCVCSIRDNRIVCQWKDVPALTCDVTKGIRARSRVVSSHRNAEEQSIHMEGTLCTSSAFISSADCKIELQYINDDDASITFPCLCSWTIDDASNLEWGFRGVWSADVRASAFDGGESEAYKGSQRNIWKAFLCFTCCGFQKTIRLGSGSDANVMSEYRMHQISSACITLIPSITEKYNFNLIQLGAR